MVLCTVGVDSLFVHDYLIISPYSLRFFTVIDTNRIYQVYMGEKAYILPETIGGVLWQSYPEVTVQENLFENT